MTWLESWEGSYNGDWFGSSNPEPEGFMRATLRGSSAVSASLTTSYEEITRPFGMGWDIIKQKKYKDDDEVLHIILQCAVNVLG